MYKQKNKICVQVQKINFNRKSFNNFRTTILSDQTVFYDNYNSQQQIYQKKKGYIMCFMHNANFKMPNRKQ